MAKKKKEENIEIKEKIGNENLSDVLETRFMPYAMSVIISRALPELCDGFKPSQRKVLYTMYKQGLLTGGRTKGANIAGASMTYNPHSSDSNYLTAVRMEKSNETLLTPFVDGKGSFGKHYSSDLQEAAARYCVSGDTYIPTDNGITKIEEIVENSKLNSENDIKIKVKSYNGKNNEAIKFFNSGIHDTYTVKVEGGPEITGTENHPLLSIDNEMNLVWKLIGDIKPGDYVILDKDTSNSMFGKNNDLQEAAMLGCMISEGCITTQNRINIVNSDLNLIKPVKDFFDKKVPGNTANIRKRKTDKIYDYTICSEEYFPEFVKKYEYEKSAKNKKIPKCALEGTKQYLSVLLSYLFEGDGSVRKNNGIFTHGINDDISYSSYSETLIKQIQNILISQFGIFSNIVRSNKKDEIKIVIKSSEIKKFVDEIGFISETKKRLANSLEFIEPANNSLFFYNGMNDYIRNQNNKIKRSICFEKRFNFYKDQLKEALPKEAFNKIENIFNRYYIGKIKTKEYAGKQAVYSLKVNSECHSFTGNGFINHNTEMKLSPVANELFKTIKKNPENLIPNYDETTVEPKILPVTFPNILANPNKGVAVAFTCEFPSFNLSELCDATIEMVKHFDDSDKKNLTRLLKVLPAPDFTSGAQLLYNEAVMRELYSKGVGSLLLRSKFHYDKKENILEIIEIPFSTTAEAIIDGIVKAVKENRLKDVVDVRDEISKDGFKVALDLRRGADVEDVKNRLYSLTKVQDTLACNLTLIHNGNPSQMGVLDILKNWIIWRREEVTIETKFDLKEKEDRLHLLQGLEKILLDIDKAVEIVKKSADDNAVITNLMKAFKIDELQANFVAEIKLRNFNKDYILNKTKEIKTLEDEIKALKEVLKSGIDDKIIADLTYVKKTYGIPRKTEIVYDYEVNNEDFSADAIDDNEEYKVFYSKEEIKKLDKDSKATLPEGWTEFNCKGSDEILVFATNGNVHKIKVSKMKAVGSTKRLDNLVDIEIGSEILFVTPLLEKNLIIVFENGKAAKFPLSVYKTTSNAKCLKKGFNVNSKPILIKVIEDENEIITLKTTGKDQKIKAGSLSLKSTRTTQGVQVVTSKKLLPLPNNM